MKLTFLGTGAGSPSLTRNVSALGLQWPQRASLWLFDAGEGTQQQVLRSPLKLSQLEHIYVTHLHGDHVFGLPGLLASRSSAQDVQSPVTIFGPLGLEEWLRVTLRLTATGLKFPLLFETVSEGLIYEDDTREVYCRRLNHRIASYGYAVVEKPRPGTFNAEKAQALGIPSGPLYGLLKSGETVTLPDGRAIDGRDLVGPMRPGRKIVICGDTGISPAAVELARGADVLVHEATFTSDQAERAVAAGHSTAAEAASVARESGVGTLILTHISSRYESDSEPGVGALLAEAQVIFPNTLLARDFWSYEISG
ncbi:MAG: ribonuclease Z [Janthinobacterium lividum]